MTTIVHVTKDTGYMQMCPNDQTMQDASFVAQPYTAWETEHVH